MQRNSKVSTAAVRVLAAGIAASLVAVTAMSMIPTAVPDSVAGLRPRCKAVTEPARTQHSKSRRSGAYNVAFRVRCNFLVAELKVRPSKPLVRMLERPTLERPDPEDALFCGRRSRILGRCTGEVGEQVRIHGALKVKGDPCCDEKLRVGFRAFGGEDCDPPATACPDIAYRARVFVKRPRGCPKRASRLGQRR